MSSYEATAVIASAIQSVIRQPIGAPRILLDSDEQVALTIIDALEAAGFEILRRREIRSD